MVIRTVSKYTTQVRFICESKAGIVEPYTNISYTEIIERARPKIFNFSYPIWNENKRKELETNILKHFYTNEIGSETFGLMSGDGAATTRESYNIKVARQKL